MYERFFLLARQLLSAFTLVPTMKFLSGTSRRLVLAFAALVTLFGIASYFALVGYSEIHEEMHRVKLHEAAAHTALDLANAVRDQYVHQAHTSLAESPGELTSYDEARRRVVTLLGEARGPTTGREERQLLDDIQLVSAELDNLFRAKILPAMAAGDHSALRQLRARANDLVSFLQRQADRLAHRLQASIAGLEKHAATVEHVTFRWMAFFLVTATLFAAAVGLYIGRSVARPVALLEEGAARLAGGDLSTRIRLDSTDEFGRLADQFNAMTAALNKHQQALLQSERLAGIGRLAAGVAHEINNPLGVILGYVQALRKTAEGPLAEDLGVIEEEAVRCKEIVHGLRELSRPFNATADPVDLRELAEDVVSRIQELFEVEGIAIEVIGEDVVQGHSQKLRQVLLNLVRNAVEASAPAGKVRVDIQRRPDGCTALSVCDTGPGIPVEARARLFEPFFTTKPTGTGLGLAVSQAIAHAHGGKIEFEERPASGAVFTLTLPRGPEEAV